MGYHGDAALLFEYISIMPSLLMGNFPTSRSVCRVSSLCGGIALKSPRGIDIRLKKRRMEKYIYLLYIFY